MMFPTFSQKYFVNLVFNLCTVSQKFVEFMSKDFRLRFISIIYLINNPHFTIIILRLVAPSQASTTGFSRREFNWNLPSTKPGDFVEDKIILTCTMRSVADLTNMLMILDPEESVLGTLFEPGPLPGRFDPRLPSV